MSEPTEYPPGTPSWVDLGTPDTEVAAAFYGAVFGWSADMDPRAEAGGYGMFTLEGKNVAGIGPQMNKDLPPYWTTYVTVTDVADTLAKVKEAGGNVIMGPIDVFDAGVMGVLQDSNGTFLSIWQPKAHIGAQLINQPNTFAWCELATDDLAAAQKFYQAVFGWGLEPHASSDRAAIFTVGGRVTCGAHTAGPGEFPAWSVWFAVDDCDAAAARATEVGGSVIMPPTDMDFGRGAVLADPHGAVFGIGKMGPAAQATTS